MPIGGNDDTVEGSQPTMGNESEIPDLVAQRYKIVRWLGGGGMGRVYEAVDIELDEKVALKVLKKGLSVEAIERFRREVKLTRRIQHPNVARMHDIGDHGDDKFLTMELIVGEPLTHLGKPLAYGRVLSIGRQVCAGLAAAHEKGVIHRDLKPDNVLIETGTERAVLTDFGIARTADDPTVTQVGSVVGTPRYMSPEQLVGNDVDTRSDVFALGVILYELLAGRRPWPGDSPVAIALAQQSRVPDPLPAEVPPGFVTVLARCLELEPDRRPQTATELLEALSVLAALPDDAPTRPTKPTVPPRTVERATPPPSAPAVTLSPAPITLSTPTTLAVLPLACAPGDEYLADAVLEELIDTLSSTAGLRVRPAGIVRAATDPDPRVIGRQLDVDHVVTGAVRRTPAGIRVSARLIGVTDGFQIWAHRADGGEAEVLSIADQLVRGIASALSTRATAPTRPTDPRAVDLYLRARAELRLFWASHASAAADLLDQAFELSPTAQIAGTRALAATQAWVMSNERHSMPRARDAIERGLSFNHPEAYLASASFKLNAGDPIGGAKDLGIAVVRAPMLAQAHEMAGRILVEIDAIAEARKHFETAMSLDPTRAHLQVMDLARLDALEGRWERADEAIARVLADPDKSITQLASIFKARLASWRGDKEAMFGATTMFAPRMGAQATRLITFISQAAESGMVDPTVWQQFVAVFGGADRPHRSQLIGLQILAEIALTLDRKDLALETLDQAEKLGLIDVVVLDHCPLFETVAHDGKFRALRNRVAIRAADVLAAYRSTSRG